MIASLNGVTPEGWTDYARAMQDAGAAAIELNVYYLPGDPDTSGRDVEQRHVESSRRVKDAVTVPVAVKLSPYFSSFGEIALRLDEAGADALVLFNRFLQPDIDPEALAIVPRVTLSNAGRRPACRGRGSPCCTEGCAPRSRPRPASRTPADVATLPARRGRRRDDAPRRSCATGPSTRRVLLDGLSAWMARKGLRSVDELRGMLSVPTGADRSAYERAGYVSALRAANTGSYSPY